MPSLFDCYSCECLIAADESRCPFCGASQRSTTAPSWLVVGISLGLTFGLGTLSCAGDDGETGESTMTMTGDPSASATADIDTTTDSTTEADTTTTEADTTTTTDSTTTTTTGTTTTTTTDGTSTSTTTYDPSNADAVTYGGPDSTSWDSDWTASDS